MLMYADKPLWVCALNPFSPEQSSLQSPAISAHKVITYYKLIKSVFDTESFIFSSTGGSADVTVHARLECVA